jgi:hypothetical protein
MSSAALPEEAADIMPLPVNADLNRAVLEALSGDSGLTTLLGTDKVFDRPPQSAAYPYVNLGETEVRNWSTQTSSGLEHRLTLHAWSRQPGQLEAQAIVQRIHDVLELAALPIASGVLVNLRVTFWTVLALGDGETMHGIVRLRAVTEAAG